VLVMVVVVMVVAVVLIRGPIASMTVVQEQSAKQPCPVTIRGRPGWQGPALAPSGGPVTRR
jgi:hypothetical protein